VGITQAQCSEFGWGDTLHPDDADRTIAAWKECVRTEGVWDIEHRFRGRDGQYHPILARGVPVRDARGEITCWAGINLDISRVKEAELARLAGQFQIELQHRLMEQREHERQQIARNIHDGPIQMLVSTMFNIQLLKEMLDNPQLETEINQIGFSVKNTIQELRGVVNELRPPSLVRFGLTRTIRAHAEEFNEKHPELDLLHELEDDQNRLPADICLALFRIYQEALNNIIRHAGATRASVTLAFEEETAVLEIQDNGRGLDALPDLISQTEQGHFGLAGMQERAEGARGQFNIRSAPGKGTTVTVKIPLGKPDLPGTAQPFA
jgi:signal transduction histidine kinase